MGSGPPQCFFSALNERINEASRRTLFVASCLVWELGLQAWGVGFGGQGLMDKLPLFTFERPFVIDTLFVASCHPSEVQRIMVHGNSFNSEDHGIWKQLQRIMVYGRGSSTIAPHFCSTLPLKRLRAAVPKSIIVLLHRKHAKSHFPYPDIWVIDVIWSPVASRRAAPSSSPPARPR